MKSTMKFVSGLVLLLAALSSWALDLDAAREAGLVGERLDGYVGVISTSAETEALVRDINQQRKEHYQEIANKQNTPLANIEKIAGEKLVGKARQQGFYFQSADGEWAQD